ncbi:glycosyltransferase WbuB [Paenibacillus hexagrammi]|uniref:Glycosyltransferase WbuB n=1 Tax=Paenibacillus hexagrammi TaxID=2908839 RepID=A0ABY3SMA5_9BACL|nr:glycosyltransferase WbuB [Paenibacillus sp. YPD9-1]UJF34326.1 glycosyltransferase WbuB [Paenibacillus sp. YPD9-1]
MSNKILLYSINYAPELTGIGKYNAEMVEWLTKNGYEVRVITAPPYYPEWKVRQGYSAFKYIKENVGGAQVFRCPLWIPRSPSGLKRLLHLASFALSSIPVVIKQMFWKPHLILVIEPPLAISPMALLFSKIFNVKSWLHVQDLEVDAAFDLGILPNKEAVSSIVRNIERWMMKKFTIVSSISESMNDRIANKGISRDMIRLFPNWVVVSDIFPMKEIPQGYRNQLGIKEYDFVVLYSGNMGEKQGLEYLLEAANLLKERPNIKFIMCGDGASKTRLVKMAEQYRLEHVYFLPLQPKDMLNELLNTADTHALIQKKSASDLVMPSKLTGMLASGRSIIATADANTAVHSVITQANAGLVVPAEDVSSLANAILNLSDDKVGRQTYGENARDYAVNCLSIENIMKDFVKDYKSFIGFTPVTNNGVKAQGHS